MGLLAGPRVAAGATSPGVVVVTPASAAVVKHGCAGAARVVRMLGLVTRPPHVLARFPETIAADAGVLAAELRLLRLVATAVPVVEPIVGCRRSGRRGLVGRATRRPAAVVSAAVDACGECEAGEDERHCGSSDHELHRGSFPSLHCDEGCRRASQARAKAGQGFVKPRQAE